jgi:hypothetical protein
LGLTWAYGIDLATYLVAIAFVFLVHSQRPAPAESAESDRGWSAALAGVRFLKGRRVLQSTFTIDIVAMVFGMPRVLFPRWPRRVSAAARNGRVVVRGTRARRAHRRADVGLGRRGSPPWTRDHHRGHRVGRGDHRLRTERPPVGLALVCLAIAGGADVISAVFRSTLQQLVVPDAIRGRLSAFNILVVAGGPRLGDLEGGWSPLRSLRPSRSFPAGCCAWPESGLVATTVPRFARWHVGDPP